MKNIICEVIVCAPIDEKARSVVSQSGCDDEFWLTVRQNKTLNDKLVGRLEELRKIFGVKNLKEHRDIKKAFAFAKRSGKEIPPALYEYITIGWQIDRLNREYAELMKINKSSTVERLRKPRWWSNE